MFITDFKNISFSNNKFKSLFHIKHNEEINKKINYLTINLFDEVDGYLHKGLLKENEHPISLIKRTEEDKRIVRILNEYLEPKSYKINVSKTNYEDSYLVTLSDITKMQAKHQQTHHKAYYDGLTKVYNRNKFDEVLENEINIATNHEDIFSVSLIDIDKFKDFNDTFGHLVGDEVLLMMAQTVNKNVRDSDTFARWGGEEFVILFKNTSVNKAEIISNKLRQKIQNLQHPIAGSITASFGVTEYMDGDTADSIFKRCDEALYFAKENGRNRVEILLENNE